MFIFWSIKTAFDGLLYASGASDKLQGTGVWSFIKLSRNQEEDKDTVALSKMEEESLKQKKE